LHSQIIVYVKLFFILKIEIIHNLQNRTILKLRNVIRFHFIFTPACLLGVNWIKIKELSEKTPIMKSCRKCETVKLCDLVCSFLLNAHVFLRWEKKVDDFLSGYTVTWHTPPSNTRNSFFLKSLNQIKNQIFKSVNQSNFI
jgi:hypothetical protein